MIIIHRVRRGFPSRLWFDADKLNKAEYNGSDIRNKYNNEDACFVFPSDYTESMEDGWLDIEYNEDDSVRIQIEMVRSR